MVQDERKEGGMMNAQDRWKSFYSDFKMALKYSTGSSDEWRMDMWKVRREAALERKLEAAQRTIEAQRVVISNSNKLFSLYRNKIVELMDKCEAQEKQIETLRSELWQDQLEITWPETQ